MPKRYFHHLQERVVEAMQVTPETVREVARWTEGVDVVTMDALDAEVKFVALNVPTRDGVSRAQDGDYVVRNADGYFTVKTRRAFELEHDELED